MKKLILLLILFAGSMLAGCSNMGTYVETPEERMRRIKACWRIQLQQIVEDFDYMMLIDRESRLTYWTPRIGY